MPRNQLTITPTPFKSSRLAIPPSPFSPKYPITPTTPPTPTPTPPTLTHKPHPAPHLTPPPPNPLHWLWQCHLCNRVYQLGVTRRCLDDGHLFCAGTTTVRRGGRRAKPRLVRHQACASEFDYQGWKAWGTWRRDVRQARVMERSEDEAEDADEDEDLLTSLVAIPELGDEGRWFGGGGGGGSRKDCWARCDYPSECRWGRQYGVQTPVVVTPKRKTTTTTDVPAPNPASSPTTFDDILTPTHEPDTTTGVPENPASPTKLVSMDDLLSSARRRKRRSSGAPPSPLSSHPPAPPDEPVVSSSSATSAGGLQKALDDLEVDVRRGLEVVAGWARRGVLGGEEGVSGALKGRRKERG